MKSEPIPETSLAAKLYELRAERDELLNGKWRGMPAYVQTRLREVNAGLRRLGVEE